MINIFSELLTIYESLAKSENYEVSLLANTSAFIFEQIKDLNWSGFYLHKDSKLILGPFQGKVACNTIMPNKGVCGTSLVTKKTIVVKDVSKHPNHIYCDNNSKSEVVTPIIINNLVYGVLDLDSPVLNRFDKDLVLFLEELINLLTKRLIEIKEMSF